MAPLHPGLSPEPRPCCQSWRVGDTSGPAGPKQLAALSPLPLGVSSLDRPRGVGGPRGDGATRFTPEHAGPSGGNSANSRDTKHARERRPEQSSLEQGGHRPGVAEPPFLLPPQDRGWEPSAAVGLGVWAWWVWGAQALGRGGDCRERRFQGTGSGFHPADLGSPRRDGGAHGVTDVGSGGHGVQETGRHSWE